MRKFVVACQLWALATIFSQCAYAQDAQSLDTVTVLAMVGHIPDYISRSDSFSLETIRQTGTLNIGEALAKQPGISLLSTGSGINKPVIRGLFGNRIQIRVGGLRFDSQQWQDEHASGINSVGISKVELIKGAASVQYGPDAMGGVINVIDEQPAPPNTIKVDLNTAVHSNTLGTATDVGVNRSISKHNWHVRFGVESHGDYADGNNSRVLNSRYDGYYLRAGYKYSGNKWTSENTYQFSLNHYGFVFETGTYHLVNDSRYSRGFESPHHTVSVQLFSSQNTLQLKSSTLKIDVGYINNHRQEQEGGNRISLDMQLNTPSLLVNWYKATRHAFTLVIGGYTQFQRNKNIGSRSIIPDANTGDAGASVMVYKQVSVLRIEFGAAYNLRGIKTYQTGTINSSGQEVSPFGKILHSVNGTVGLIIVPKRYLTVKVNGATGSRAPNLAELSSDGLHEGTVRYEIGSPQLKNEQNINGDLEIAFKSKYVDVTLAGFVNHFFNYIYLEPTALEHFGFQIYRYVQKTATLQGGEAAIDIRPGISWLTIHSDYSMVIGKTNGGNYLPYMPAFKLNSEVRASHDIKKLKNAFAKVGVRYFFKQNRSAQFETYTPSYYLLDAGIGGTVSFKHGQITISILATNLLNKNYVDHLSRYKYFGLYNMGRNISLSINLPLTFNPHSKTKNQIK